MHKFLIFGFCWAAACVSNFTSAQSRTVSVKTVVIAVKGSVNSDGNRLRKGDTVNLSTGNKARLQFAHPTDWIKLLNPSTKKVITLYKQKQVTTFNCLGTRGSITPESPPDDLYSYFARGTIFLFETDTIILRSLSDLSESESIPFFQVTFSGKVYNRKAGSPDTIFISRENLYDFIPEGLETVHPFRSLVADSVRLVFFNTETNRFDPPSCPYAQILFFHDMVSFLQGMDLTEEEVFRELTDSFADLSVISRVNNLADDNEAALWLKRKIRLAMISADRK